MDEFQNKRFNKVKRVIEGVLFNATKTFKLLGLMKLIEPRSSNAEILDKIYKRILCKVTDKRYRRILENSYPFPMALYNHDLVYRELTDLVIQGIIDHKDEFRWTVNINSELRLNKD